MFSLDSQFCAWSLLYMRRFRFLPPFGFFFLDSAVLAARFSSFMFGVGSFRLRVLFLLVRCIAHRQRFKYDTFTSV